MNSTSLLRIGSSLLWLALPALAHDLYLIPASFRPDGNTIRVSVYDGDTFPESELAPKLDRLKDVVFVGWKGRRAIESLAVRGNAIVGTATLPGNGSVIAAAQTIPATVQQDAAKFNEYLREEGLDHVIGTRTKAGQMEKPGRERSRKSAKAILLQGGADGFESQPLGQTLEFIPVKMVEADFRVKVLFQSKPAKDLQVTLTSADGKKRILGRTDENGVVAVSTGGRGIYRLHAIRMERCPEPKVADWESYSSTLTFQID